MQPVVKFLPWLKVPSRRREQEQGWPRKRFGDAGET